MKKDNSLAPINERTIPGVERFIYQPNRITEAYYDFRLIQERIFNVVKFQLQESVKKRMSGQDYTQLELFTNSPSSDIVLNIPLKEVASKQQYPNVREACKQLAGLVVTVPYWEENKKQKRIRYTGLLRADLPENAERSAFIRIYIDRQVAKLLIEIDLDAYNKPINYTKYLYEVIKKSRKKYTPRIYLFLCSWKLKGERIISIDELRMWLGLGDKYKYYRDIKKFILEPVQNDLLKIKADCWYDCNSACFEIKKKNVVTHLNFQIISPDLLKDHESKRDYVRFLLQSYFNIKEDKLSEIQSIIAKSNPYDLIEKVSYLNKVVQAKREKGEIIEMLPNYVIQSLLND